MRSEGRVSMCVLFESLLVRVWAYVVCVYV